MARAEWRAHASQKKARHGAASLEVSRWFQRCAPIQRRSPHPDGPHVAFLPRQPLPDRSPEPFAVVPRRRRDDAIEVALHAAGISAGCDVCPPRQVRTGRFRQPVGLATSIRKHGRPRHVAGPVRKRGAVGIAGHRRNITPASRSVARRVAALSEPAPQRATSPAGRGRKRSSHARLRSRAAPSIQTSSCRSNCAFHSVHRRS